MSTPHGTDDDDHSSPAHRDAAEIERWRRISARNLARFWEDPVRAMGQRWAEWDDVRAADASSPTPFPNSATLLQPPASADAGDLARRLRAFYAAGHGGAWMLWSAWPTPDLRPYGFQHAGQPPLMVRPAGAAILPAPPELQISEARDEAALAQFNTVFIEGYPVEELREAGINRVYDARVLGGALRFWVGSVAGQPVTAAAAVVGEEAISIYAVATLAQARGRGYGAAITAHATQAAPALPAELQSSEAGQSVYLGLGFQIVTHYTLWVHPRAA